MTERGPNVIYYFIEYQNKKHAFNWLNTLHVTITILRYRLGCWYRPVQKPCLDWCYISINRYFKTPSMILIKSTLYIKNVHLSVCKVLFIPKIAVSVKVSW